MAHSYPTCDSYCTCGCDIDDCQFDGTAEQDHCTHCPYDGEEIEYEEDDYDD